MSETDDKQLIEYLHRRSALSLGYKKIYIEAPPAELDRAIKARARRALKFLGPAVIATLLVVTVFGMLIVGVNKFMSAAVRAERYQLEQANPPIAIDLTIGTSIETKSEPTPSAVNKPPAKLSREQWQQKIEALQTEGKNVEAEAELKRFRQAYPQ